MQLPSKQGFGSQRDLIVEVEVIVVTDDSISLNVGSIFSSISSISQLKPKIWWSFKLKSFTTKQSETPFEHVIKTLEN